MTEFESCSITHPIIRWNTDYNNVLDHAFEKTAAYIIRKNGSTYEAISGNTGKIPFSNALYATVIQACHDALTSGGRIHHQKGTYTALAQINISNDKITVTGEGAASIIYCASDILVFNVTGDNSLFRDLNFRSGHDPEVQTLNRAIYGDNAAGVTIQNCLITSTGNTTAWRIGFDFLSCTDIDISGCSGSGGNNAFGGRTCTRVNIHDNIGITSPTDNIIDIGGTYLKIVNNVFPSASFVGWVGHTGTINAVYIAANSSYVEVSDNYASLMQYQLVGVQSGCHYIEVCNNIAIECGTITGGEQGIRL